MLHTDYTPKTEQANLQSGEAWPGEAESLATFIRKGLDPNGKYSRRLAQIRTKQPGLLEAVQVAPEHTLSKRLADRRISERTVLTFDIQPNGTGWVYPVPGGGEARRWKAYDPNSEYKYKWIPGKPEGCEYYHADNLLEAIQQNAGACWAASGEPDLWALYSAGIEHAISFGYGEGAVPANLAEALQNLGVMVLYIAPDLDEVGRRWAGKVDTALQGSGIELDTRQLPSELGKHGDLGKAWERYTRDGWPFERWLLGLPKMTIEPVAAKEKKPTPRLSPSGDYSDIPDEFKREIARALKTDWPATENIICPIHPSEEHPSARLLEAGLYCHHDGKTVTWNELAGLLVLPGLAEWRRKQSAQVYRQLSTETREAMDKQGYTNQARLLSLLYAAGIAPGSAFTIPQAAKLTGMDRRAVWRLMTKTTAKVKTTLAGGASAAPTTTTSSCSCFGSCSCLNEPGNLSRFFPPDSLLQQSLPAKNATNSIRGRKSRAYRLLSPEEVAGLAGVDPATWQHFDVIPPEKIKKAADYKAEVYAALPRRRPGNYSRGLLASRQGVCIRTTQNYDKRAGLEVTPRQEREELQETDIDRLADDREDVKGGIWLEDDQGLKYPAVKEAAARLFLAGGKVERVQQLSNHYGPGEEAGGAESAR